MGGLGNICNVTISHEALQVERNIGYVRRHAECPRVGGGGGALRKRGRAVSVASVEPHHADSSARAGNCKGKGWGEGEGKG